MGKVRLKKESEREKTMAEKEEQRVAVRPFRPLRSLWDLREEMDRLWEGLPAFPRFRRITEEPAWPAVDVFDERLTVVKADVPGMTAKDIEVSVTEDGITISGERSGEGSQRRTTTAASAATDASSRQVAPGGRRPRQGEATFKDGVSRSAPLKRKNEEIEVKSS
jgi:HSP20 family protein